MRVEASRVQAIVLSRLPLKYELDHGPCFRSISSRTFIRLLKAAAGVLALSLRMSSRIALVHLN